MAVSQDGNRLIARIRRVGLWSTLMYVGFTVIPERLGVEFTALYRTSVSATVELMEDVKVYVQEQELPSRTRQELIQAGGDPIREQIPYAFGRGYILAVGHHNGRAASVSWLSRATRGAASMKKGDWSIHSCLTFPEARGRCLYPKSIAALCGKAFQQSSSKDPVHVYIESSVTNRASIRGIERCGFRKVGYLLRFRNRVIFSNDFLQDRLTFGIRV
jgi:hypothetical protein